MMHSKILQLVTLSVVALLVVSAPALAAPVLMPLAPADFTSFDVAGQATVLISEPYNYNNTFAGLVHSQVFNLDNGDYLYLYQAANHGPSVLEVLAISPFGWFTQSGYLTGNSEPAGFLAGGYLPAGATNDPTIPNISYNYPAFMGAHVPAGFHTVTLYLVSPYAPALGEAYVINSGVSVVPTFVAIPEPATMLLLGTGCALIGLRRRRRNRKII